MQRSLLAHRSQLLARVAVVADVRLPSVTTVVAAGVSLNIGILGLVIEAVGEGFDAVVVTDAVVGIPARFGDDVLRNALAYIATLTTTDELLAAWS